MKILHNASALMLCSTLAVWAPTENAYLNTSIKPQPATHPDSTRLTSPLQQRSARPPQVEAPPFAEVLGIERIRLADPIQFRGRDGVRPVTDFILISVRLQNFLRFTPRGIGPDQIMFNDEPAEFLWLPTTNAALIAPVPTVPLENAELWIAPFSSKKADTLERVKELRAKASRRGAADLISLGSPVREGLASTEIRQFTNRNELQNYAREMIKRR